MTPRISVIIPVRNGGDKFARCLAALSRSDYRDYELIVVDDGSTDSSAALALQHHARILGTSNSQPQTPNSPSDSSFRLPHSSFRLPHSPSGPAFARNLGAREAQGDLLFFVDADVEVRPDTLPRMAAAFDADPTLTAAFGSYDDAPAEADFLSQYRNLFHHYVHQTARAEASTFWAGCGMIRRETFLAVGGFDALAYPRPSIEDIDLGYRLIRAGGRTRLLKDAQVKHLKRWKPLALLRVDILDRGVPWTRLLWRESFHPHCNADRELLDLNLQGSSRASVVLAYLLLFDIIGSVLVRFLPLVASVPLLFTALLWLNRDLVHFFLRMRGLGFLLMALPWHWLYYLYNGVSFALGTAAYFLRGAPEADPQARADTRVRPDEIVDEG